MVFLLPSLEIYLPHPLFLCAHMCYMTKHMNIGEQTVGVIFLLPPCGAPGINSSWIVIFSDRCLYTLNHLSGPEQFYLSII